MANILEVHDLATSFYTYDGEVEAVRGVSFSVEEGAITGVIGESGCGKSVTALSIMKMLSTRGKIKTGKIVFQGTDITRFNEKQMLKIRGNQIAMVFQNSMTSLNPLYTIGNQMGEVISFHKKTNSAQTRQKSIEMLRLVGLQDAEKWLNAYPHQLSGGMRQRVAIAIALSCEPALLIADEPTTALDVTLQIQILEILQKMAQQKKISVLLITHDLSVVANICTQILVMYGGRIVEAGDTNSIFNDPQHPYTQGLLRTVQDLDGARRQNLYCIDGLPPKLLNPPKGCPFADRCPHTMQVCRMEMPIAYGSIEHRTNCWLLDEACPGRCWM